MSGKIIETSLISVNANTVGKFDAVADSKTDSLLAMIKPGEKFLFLSTQSPREQFDYMNSRGFRLDLVTGQYYKP